jgi:malate dehydrogenase (oxaloacetate-decarboxylating)(NADP+)
VLKPEHVARMSRRPLILALANPVPEIMPEEARTARPEAVIATGRSDYPNQVNNVLCFPFIFRGALDVGATTINEAMKIACVKAIADLAMREPSDVVAAAYGDTPLTFGPDYLIPKPFDPRLIIEIAPAVAKAAMESGVATRPIADFAAYRERLTQFVFRSGLTMRPVFERARQEPKRLVYTEGEDERVLRAVQQVIGDGIARPIVIGRRDVVQRRLEKLNLRVRIGEDFELVDPQDDPRFQDYWKTYHALTERKGVSPDFARYLVRTRNTVIGALMVRKGDADALLCGVIGQYHRHLRHILDIIGLSPGATTASTLSALVLPKATYFLCDGYVALDPTAEQVAEITIRAAEAVRHFGVEPKVALLSHSSFGSSDAPSARKMADAVRILHQRAPGLEVEGEMHGDQALDADIRRNIFPRSRLEAAANLVVCPSLDAANIAFNLLKTAADGLHIGPMLLGTELPAHVLTPSVTARGILNMTALAAVEAQRLAEAEGARQDAASSESRVETHG